MAVPIPLRVQLGSPVCSAASMPPPGAHRAMKNDSAPRFRPNFQRRKHSSVKGSWRVRERDVRRIQTSPGSPRKITRIHAAGGIRWKVASFGSPSSPHMTQRRDVSGALSGSVTRGTSDREVASLRVVHDDRGRRELGLEHGALGRRDADLVGREELQDLELLLEVGTGGVAEAVARALILHAEERRPVLGVLPMDPELAPHARVEHLGERLGRLGRDPLEVEHVRVLALVLQGPDPVADFLADRDDEQADHVLPVLAEEVGDRAGALLLRSAGEVEADVLDDDAVALAAGGEPAVDEGRLQDAHGLRASLLLLEEREVDLALLALAVLQALVAAADPPVVADHDEGVDPAEDLVERGRVLLDPGAEEGRARRLDDRDLADLDLDHRTRLGARRSLLVALGLRDELRVLPLGERFHQAKPLERVLRVEDAPLVERAQVLLDVAPVERGAAEDDVGRETAAVQLLEG